MSSRFSALLLAGGRSRRMGKDKAFIEVDGVPLWRRQLQMLQALHPHELFIAGPPHQEWREANAIIIPDATADAGPLAGVVAGLRRSSAQLLLTIAIDLPAMTSVYLRALVNGCSNGCGVVPTYGAGYEPLAAVYPNRALALAEKCLASRKFSLQRFAARCAVEGLIDVRHIASEQRALFLNMNTPADVAALTHA